MYIWSQVFYKWPQFATTTQGQYTRNVNNDLVNWFSFEPFLTFLASYCGDKKKNENLITQI